jgi:hypothetical protein
VLIVRVTTVSVNDKVVGGDQDVDIKGHFYYNNTKDITKPLKERTRATRMIMETWDIVDVFEAEDGPLILTADNIEAIEASFRAIQEHDATV